MNEDKNAEVETDYGVVYVDTATTIYIGCYAGSYDFVYDTYMNTMPANCTLKFAGGSLNNGVFVGNNTLLDGDVRMSTLLKGTFANKEFKVSWFDTGSAEFLSNTIASIFTLSENKCIVIDKDITLTGSEKYVDHVNFRGELKPTITNPDCYYVTGDTYVKGVRIIVSTAFSGFAIQRFTDITDFNAYFEDVYFDGGANRLATAMYYASNKTSSYEYLSSVRFNITILNCEVTRVRQYVVRCIHTGTATVKNNYFHDFGYSYGVGNTQRHATGLLLGSASTTTFPGGKFNDSDISFNKVENILCTYSTADNGREVHAFLIYGDNNKICYNVVKNIYSDNGEGQDPGQDSEGIYLKGGSNLIAYNYVYSANGTRSDAAITIKGHEPYNIIKGNYVYHRYRAGITSYNNDTIIEDNCVVGVENAFIGIYVLSGSARQFIRSNKVVRESTTNPSSEEPSAFYLYNITDCVIDGNDTKGYPSLLRATTCYGDIMISNNRFYLENYTYPTVVSGNIREVVSAKSNISAAITVKDNIFTFAGVIVSTGNGAFAQSNKINIDNNKFYFNSYTDEENSTTTYCQYEYFLRGPVTFCNNELNLTGESGEDFTLSNSSNAIIKNNSFSGLDVVPSITGGDVLGNYIKGAKVSGSGSDMPALTKVQDGFLFYQSYAHQYTYSDGTNWRNFFGDIVYTLKYDLAESGVTMASVSNYALPVSGQSFTTYVTPLIEGTVNTVVRMGGVTLTEGTNYSYTSATGELTITGTGNGGVTGNLYIKIRVR